MIIFCVRHLGRDRGRLRMGVGEASDEALLSLGQDVGRQGQRLWEAWDMTATLDLEGREFHKR